VNKEAKKFLDSLPDIREAIDKKKALPELFLTPIGNLKKVKIKDGWGNSAFLIKGKLPSWVKDVKAGAVTEHKYKNMTIGEIIAERTGDEYKVVDVERIVPVALLVETVIHIAVQFVTGKDKVILQRIFVDYIVARYPKAKFKMVRKEELAGSMIIAVSDGEAVAMVIPLNLDSSEVTILAPDELLEVTGEWRKDGLETRDNLGKYKRLDRTDNSKRR